MYTLEKLSLALVASLATGAQAGLSWQHRRHLHLMPRDGNYDSHNTTMVGPSGTAPYGTAPMGTGPMTTSVIYATSVVTVTSCGPTVTACPASSTVLSTVVVPVSTTTCPVSGPTAPHGTGIPGTGSVANPSVTTPPSPPLGTGVTPHINSTATTTMTEETNSTLTYTIGAGSSTSVVTTTLKVQTTRTQTSFVYATTEASSGSGSDGEKNGGDNKNVVNPVGESGDSSISLPTTIESTSTQFLTVSAVPVGSPEAKPSSVAAGGSEGGSGSGAGGDSGATCPPPSTVTVTATAKETVTVTAEAGVAHPSGTMAPYGNGTDSNSTHIASTGFATGIHPTGSIYPTASSMAYYRRH